MAGSNRFFLYTDDAGVTWAINREETTTEDVNQITNESYPGANTAILNNRGFITPRYLNYNSADGLYRRTVTLLLNTPEALTGAPTTITINSEGSPVTLYLTSYIGERRRIVPELDSRQQDGDAEAPSAGGGT